MKNIKHHWIWLFVGLTSLSFLSRPASGDISREMVRQAAELIGLHFTDAEIDTMLPNLEDHRENFQQLRDLSLDNGLYPTLVFNPILPGLKTFAGCEDHYYGEQRPVVRPDDDAELAWMSVRDLGHLIRSRQISSVELTRFFIQRLRELDPTLRFVVTITEERALEKARQADESLANGRYLGPLHGIPYGAKDLLAARGYKTTWGATPYRDQVIDEDATLIRKLDEAGAILVAKTTLGALAWGDVWFDGQTRNPWDTLRGSSGSSAGSASAVAAGALPFAIGSETLGSIVSPSTVCGVTGLRPTFGRVSRHGAMALSWTMDKLGPIARSALDCSLVLEAIAGPDPVDPYTLPGAYTYDDRIQLAGLKVGYLAGDFHGDYPFKKQDSATLAYLRERGVELIPVELPDYTPLGIILSAEAAAAFDEVTTKDIDDQMVRQERFAWPNFFRAARMIPAVEYIKANRVRHQLMLDMDSLFREVDVLIHPSWASDALVITNLTGHPTIVMPNGMRRGTPTSISITGQLLGEAMLVRVAREIQDGTEWDDRHPEWLVKGDR
jgi:Asp-tRNA(Asn)/Glu-tRNA(Gln) amidotransferase A subunit family amidase